MTDSHSALYSFPSNSTPQAYPHGVQSCAPPLSSHPVGLQVSYSDHSQSSHTWVTDQVTIGYPIPTAIQPLIEKPITVSGSNPLQTGNSRNPSLVRKAHKRKPKPKNKPSNMSQSVRCEICDVYCTSIMLYEKHLSGKKHLKTLRKRYAPIETSSQPTSQPAVNSSLSVPPASVSGNPIQDAPSATSSQPAIQPVLNSSLSVPPALVIGNSIQDAPSATSSQPTSQPVINTSLSVPTSFMSGNSIQDAPSAPIGEGSSLKKQKLVECGCAIDSVRVCATCNVVCNSEKSLTDHLAGKRHRVQEMAVTSVSGRSMKGASSVSVGEDIDASKPKLIESRVAEECNNVCTANNDMCNRDVPLPDDSAGKNNSVQVAMTSTLGGHENKGVSSVAVGVDLGTKKLKLMQAGVAEGSVHVCTTCNIVCNSEVVFADHIAGKKHAAQVQKSIGGGASNPIEPKPLTTKSSAEDVEAKRQKVEGSGTPSEAVRVCSLCKVVCNSEIVFNDHLAGQKHASMVKKLAGNSTAGAVASATT